MRDRKLLFPLIVVDLTEIALEMRWYCANDIKFGYIYIKFVILLL